jgi:hypothetical protein
MTTFTVTDRKAPRREVAPGIKAIASQVRSDAAAGTPVETGRLRAAWRVQNYPSAQGQTVINDVPYARFVEYGTRYMPPAAMLGRALARARARA